MSWSLTVNLRADPATFRIIRKLAAEAAKAEGLSHSESDAIEIAVGEALTGAYHSHGKGAPLELDIEFDGLSLIITLHDTHDNGTCSIGKPHEPIQPHRRSGPADSPPTRRLYLIRHLVDDVEMVQGDSEGAVTAIRLHKKLL